MFICACRVKVGSCCLFFTPPSFIEKATWGLAAFMVVACIVATYAIPQAEIVDESLLQQNAIENNAVNPTAVPDLSEPVAPEAPAQGE